MSIEQKTSMMKRITNYSNDFAHYLNEAEWVKYTEYFILAMITIIIVVDLFLAFNNIEEDTISEVLQNWAYSRFFVITWAWGVLAGHLFLTRATPIFNSPNPIVILLGLTTIILLAGFFNKTIVALPMQVVLLIMGAIAGYLLWPQSPVV